MWCRGRRSFELSDLSYAPEIAQVMLVRQQALAMVDAGLGRVVTAPLYMDSPYRSCYYYSSPRSPARARSHRRVVPPLIRFIPDPRTYSVPLFLRVITAPLYMDNPYRSCYYV